MLIVRFKIAGRLRFLSHAELLRVFQRACIRAGIKIQYTQGFNPHPKLSLPLPKSVGIEVDDDILCLWLSNNQTLLSEGVSETQAEDYGPKIKENLSKQLPEGIDILSVKFVQENKAFQPYMASYLFPVQPQYFNDELKSRVKRLLSEKSLIITRLSKPNRPAISSSKTVDVRPFLKSIEFGDNSVVVECKISGDGSIRIEEILKLLELDTEKLAAPIKRIGVKYQNA